MKNIVAIGLLLASFAASAFAVSLFRSDQGGTGANNSAAPVNSFAKWIGSAPATLTNAACTESGGVIAGCTAPATTANPSASVGFTVVNGAATTAMRSDAAPALAAIPAGMIRDMAHAQLGGM